MILKVNETAHRDFTSGIILLNPAIFQAESYKGRIKSNFMNQRFRYRKYLTYALASGILAASLTLGAVSYTHLDVYKRQRMCFIPVRLF